MANKIRSLFRFFGARIIKWMFIGSVASFLLGYIELLVTVALQLILKELDILKEQLSLPLFLEHWKPTLSDLFILFIVIVLFRLLFQLVVIMSSAISYVVMGARLRGMVFYELLQKRTPVFISAAEVNFRITEISQKTAVFCNFSVAFINYFVQGLTLIFIMFFLSKEITLIALLLLSVLGIFLLKINALIRPLARQMPLKVFSINRGIQRVAQNWLLVRILRTNNKEYENLINNELRYRFLDLRIVLLTFMTNILPQTLGMLLVLSIIFINIEFFHIQGAIFISFLYLFLRFVHIVAQLSQFTGRAIANSPQFKKAFSDFRHLSVAEVSESVAPTGLLSYFKPSPIYKNERIHADKKLDVVDHAPKIEFNKVCFSYEKNTQEVLKDLVLTVRPGQHVGIIGKSGSGKTTMLGLLLGLLSPTRGKVMIEGKASCEFFLKYKLKIGYVGPEPFLIEGSIKENLCYGHPSAGDITEEQFTQALKLAKADAFIYSFAEGMDYKILENGEGLSAGQKQRLALARAFLIDPQLLILDEVSANLDSETESEIAESIKNLKGQCTTIIVSHKPGILKYADEVFDLDKSKRV